MKGRGSTAKATRVAVSNGVAEAMPLQSYPENNLERVILSPEWSANLKLIG
jgi:hypothetical protein